MDKTLDVTSFTLNGSDVSVAPAPGERLSHSLRERLDARDVKVGCNAGDCGACTVLVGRLVGEGIRYETVNACIRFLASLDGCHVVTVEHLSGVDGQLHPVQQAMVEHHGSQCGFCTPGFVMSLYALWMEAPNPSVCQIETALQGNLCRCTGYAPIIRAALAISEHGNPGSDWLNTEREMMVKRLASINDGKRVEVARGADRAIIPANAADLAAVLAEHPKATVVAGATDVGLWVTKFLRDISPAVFIGNLSDLKQIDCTDNRIRIGAGVTYSECEDVLGENFPHLVEFWKRIAGWQVRNMGTVGGNVANGSPIGDTPPVLIALGAQVTLQSRKGTRTLPIEDYFIDYGKQDRKPGEFVAWIDIPTCEQGTVHAAYKISKRRDEDISSVCAAFNVMVVDGRIIHARIAFGGMAATPKRASNAELRLIGKVWSEASFVEAARILGEDFTPLTDWRASADYRLRVAQNLFRRFYLENSDQAEPVRLIQA